MLLSRQRCPLYHSASFSFLFRRSLVRSVSATGAARVREREREIGTLTLPSRHTRATRRALRRKEGEEDSDGISAGVETLIVLSNKMGSQVFPSSGGAYFSSFSSPSASAAWQPVEVGVQQICYLLSQSVKPGANQAEVRGLGKEGLIKAKNAVAVPFFGGKRGWCRLPPALVLPCSFFRVRATSLAGATMPSMRQRRARQAKGGSGARERIQQQHLTTTTRKEAAKNACSLTMLPHFRSRRSLSLSCSFRLDDGHEGDVELSCFGKDSSSLPQ